MRQHLKDIEKKEGKPFDKIVVNSSPYIRTVSTASRICKENDIESIELDYTFCEWMEENMHKGRDPLPMLAINNLSYEDLDQQYDLQGITFNQVDSSVIKKASETFPENRDDVLQRC